MNDRNAKPYEVVSALGFAIGLIIVMVMMTGCAGQTTISGGVGHHFTTNLDNIYVERREAFQLELKHKHPSGVFVKATHVSNPLVWPLTESEDEFSSDSIYIGYEITIRDTEQRR